MTANGQKVLIIIEEMLPCVAIHVSILSVQVRRTRVRFQVFVTMMLDL